MSGRTVISVRGLGKRYDLGETFSSSTLRDALAAGAKRLFRGSNGNHKAVADEFWALKDVSFDVTEGEVVGIIGRNGAGKSTLLKILSGITEPTEGEIRMRGRIGALLEVGTGFHQELSGRENIFMNGAILGMSKADIRRKFDEIVEFSGVAKFIDTPVKRYSSGMTVRLAFAVAAHLEPEILIIDEVLAVGDIEFQKRCLGRMQEVVSHGRTVIFVSHSISAITNICSRAVYLVSGQVAADSTAAEAADRYLADMHRHDGTMSCDGIRLQVAVLDSAGEPLGRWRSGTDAYIQCELNDDTRRHRVIDLAFYADSGIKLFGISGDACLYPHQETKGRYGYTFRVSNPGFSVRRVFLDVGVRAAGQKHYRAVWQRVYSIPVEPLVRPSTVTDDSLMVPEVAIDCVERG